MAGHGAGSSLRHSTTAPVGATSVRGHPRSDRSIPLLEETWGVAACALCGSTIALGDRSYRVRVAGRTAHVCSECAMTAVPERARPRLVTRSRKRLVKAA